MYRPKSLTTYVSDATFAEFEKKRLELGLSKNQALKLLVLRGLGLADDEGEVEDIPDFLRGK
jgi:hypothetical protein